MKILNFVTDDGQLIPNSLKDELINKLKSDDYSEEKLLTEYSDIFQLYHNTEVRRKLNMMHNNVKVIKGWIVFFGIIAIIALLIQFFGSF